MPNIFDPEEVSQVYKDKGGNRQVVGPTGEISIDLGGKITQSGVQAALSSITDSTGGSATTTLAAVAAGAGYTQADAVALKNAVASLASQLNLIITALKNLGISS